MLLSERAVHPERASGCSEAVATVSLTQSGLQQQCWPHDGHRNYTTSIDSNGYRYGLIHCVAIIDQSNFELALFFNNY